MNSDQVLYVASTRDFVPVQELKTQPGKVLVLDEKFPTAAPLVEAIATEMANLVGATGQIKLLSFQCHGFPGGLELYSEPIAGGYNQSGGTTSNGSPFRHLVASNVHKLAVFRPCMDPTGVCELHSCNTAAASGPSVSAPPGKDNARKPAANTSSIGTNFMQALANLLGVPVRAAVKIQGGDTAVGWDGPTVTIQPVK